MRVRCLVVRTRPATWLQIVAWIAGFAALVLSPAVLNGGFRELALVVVWAACAGIAGTVLRIARERRNVEIEIDASSIEDGYASGPRLVLHHRNGSRTDAMPEAGTADDILRELGLSLDRRALDAPLRGQLGSFTRGLLAFFGTFFFASALSLVFNSRLVTAVAPFVLAVLVTALVGRLRPRLVVGLDGIRIAGVLRPRFVPYSAIRAVTGGGPIVVDLANETLYLPVIGQSADQIAALHDRIEQGRKRYAEKSARPLDALDRAGRTIAEWTEAVRRLPNAGSFRQAALDIEDLEKVVADPKAPIERRVGAALALRDPAKVRVAAEQSADPKVRVALEATLEEDEDVIERALKK